MAIGSGWADGAWVDAGWVVGAWEQSTTAKTIGGTSQLGALTSSAALDVQGQETIGGTSQLDALTSTGGITVALPLTIGGTSQLDALSSTGGVQVVPPKTIGGSSRLESFTSSGFINSGETIGGGGASRKKLQKIQEQRTAQQKATLKANEERAERIFDTPIEEVIETGKIKIGDTEVEVAANIPPKPVKPILFAPKPKATLSELRAETIAKKEHQVALKEYETQVEARELMLTEFEEELITFLLLLSIT